MGRGVGLYVPTIPIDSQSARDHCVLLEFYRWVSTTQAGTIICLDLEAERGGARSRPPRHPDLPLHTPPPGENVQLRVTGFSLGGPVASGNADLMCY